MHKEEKIFVKEKKRKLAASPHTVEKVTKKPRKIVQIHQVLLPNLHQSTHERLLSIEKKKLQNTLLMPSLRDRNAIETLLMTAQINNGLSELPCAVNYRTLNKSNACWNCESIINTILRNKDYDFHKNA
ncbi:uncharacterized protein TNCV_663371 [Trichonephila clavipes]|nr:uncharacterized protein TNCV_663371 [Trichonephila clavipes]